MPLKCAEVVMRCASICHVIRLPYIISDDRLKIINKEALEIIKTQRYDDLSQMVRMNHFSRSELAILLAVLNGESDDEESDSEDNKSSKLRRKQI